MKVLFRVRRAYFDAIRDGTKTREVRRASDSWLKTVARMCGFPGDAWKLFRDRVGPGFVVRFEGEARPIGVFLCGRDVFRRRILGVQFFAWAEEALGRYPSPQGLLDIGAGPVLGFDLGEPA